MKLNILAAISCTFLPAIAWSAARCPPQSNSWQCQQQTGSGPATGVSAQTQLPPTTAQPGTQTRPLGGVDATHNQVVLKPLPPQVITGTSKPPAITATYGGEFTGSGVVTIVVTDTRPTLIGYGKPPEPIIQPTPSFTGSGQQQPPQPQIVVTPTPQPVISGFGKPPEPTAQPTPSFTGSMQQQPPQPQIVVTPTPRPVISGFGKPPEPTAQPTPSFTGSMQQQPPQPQIVVTPTPQPVISGLGKPPEPTAQPTPSFTGSMQQPPQPQIMVIPITSPALIGYAKPQPTVMPTAASTGGTKPDLPHIVVVPLPQPSFSGISRLPMAPPFSTSSSSGIRPPHTPIAVVSSLPPGSAGHGVSPTPSGALPPASSSPGLTPTPSMTGSNVSTQPPGPSGQIHQGSTGVDTRPPGHVLIVHNPPSQRPTTSGDHFGTAPYSLEYIEPGIQNHKVEVYRSKDVRQVTYQDVNAQSQGGFHLRVLGIRNPDYAH